MGRLLELEARAPKDRPHDRVRYWLAVASLALPGDLVDYARQQAAIAAPMRHPPIVRECGAFDDPAGIGDEVPA